MATEANTSGVPYLPQELVDIVIDEVATWWHEPSNRTATLKSCSLTCRSWLARSSAHLFYCLKCVYDTSDALRTIKTIDRICSNVVHLWLSYMGTLSMAAYCDTLRSFTHLERLDFLSSPSGMEWKHSECTGLVLKSLSLHDPPPGALPCILDLFTEVDSLTLRRCYLDDPTKVKPTTCKVKSLSIVECLDDGLVGLREFFSASKSTLSSIRIVLDGYDGYPVNPHYLKDLLESLGPGLSRFSYFHPSAGWKSNPDGERWLYYRPSD
jgi:hypothetical protein